MRQGRPPALIAHCDWSVAAAKRWMCVGLPGTEGWTLAAPEQVLDPGDLLDELRLRAGGRGPVLVGFDFPIGLPRAYAATTGFRDFAHALASFGRGEWRHWYQVAREPSDISIRRPFFPYGRAVSGQRQHLLDALGLTKDDLLRRAERASGDRRAACALFWTAGANQVGKAAIAGWSQVIAPALVRKDVRVWPFQGTFADMMDEGAVVIAETYPSEIYRWLGIRLAGRKTDIANLAPAAPKLLGWLRTRGVRASPQLVADIESGFAGRASDDRFDAVVGAMGLLDVALGVRADGAPMDDRGVERWEGWILGQLA